MIYLTAKGGEGCDQVAEVTADDKYMLAKHHVKTTEGLLEKFSLETMPGSILSRNSESTKPLKLEPARVFKTKPKFESPPHTPQA